MITRSPNKQSPGRLRFSGIREGHTKSRRYIAAPSVYKNFLSAFSDTNPMHMDDVFARKNGFKSKLMHGAILNGFISHFIGTVLPGRNALLQSVNIQYRSPVYLGNAIMIRGTVSHKSAATKALEMQLTLENLVTKRVAATAKAQVGMTA